METPADQSSGPPAGQLNFNANIKNNLLETAKWGKFLGILGFILVGLMAIFAGGAGFFMNGLPVSQNSVNSMSDAASSIFMAVYFLAIALLYFFPSLYLYQFAARTKTGLLQNEETDMTQAFAHLKSFFKFWGILAIIGLALYALGLIAIFLFYGAKNIGH